MRLGFLFALLCVGSGHASVSGAQSPATAVVQSRRQVPDLTGRRADESLRRLIEDTLRVRFRREPIPSDANGRGVVLTQDPRHGTLIVRSTVITIRVGDGTLREENRRVVPPAMVEVPRLVGLPADAAAREVRRAQLNVGRDTAVHSDQQPRGLIVASKPAQGSMVPRGDSVHTVISLGPSRDPDFPMPRLKNLDTAAARARIQASRLSLYRIEPIYRRGATGTVIEQWPAVDAPVHPGERVTLQVAFPPARIPVPNLVGHDVSRASAELNAAGLRLNPEVKVETRRDLGAGIVAQDPNRDAMVDPGSSVRVTVNRPPPPLRRVPDLNGLSRAAAARLVVSAQLAPQVVRTERADTAELVYWQRPDRGSMVDSGSTVSLATQAPPPPPPPLVRVPGLMGQERTQAEHLLQQNWLASRLEASDAQQANELVYWQSSPPGAQLDSGATVRIATRRRAPPPPPQVAVPGIVGLDRGEAERRVLALGLVASGEREPVPQRREVVTTQKPPRDELVAAGSLVSFSTQVEPGPPAPPETPELPATRYASVPDVVGLSRDFGHRLLRDSGFVAVDRIPPQSESSVIASQEPFGGEVVAAGTSVSVSYSPSTARIVPDVVDRSWGDAVVVASEARFETYVLNASSFLAWRRVREQEPKPGQAVDDGARIALTLGLPTVPLAAGTVLLLVAAGTVVSRTGKWRLSTRPTVRGVVSLPQTTLEPPGRDLVERYLEVRFSMKLESPILTCEEGSVLKSHTPERP